MLGLKVPPMKPIIGANVFATAAGIHQSGILRDPSTYEFVHPEMFGRERRMYLSRHSGHAALSEPHGGSGVARW